LVLLSQEIFWLLVLRLLLLFCQFCGQFQGQHNDVHVDISTEIPRAFLFLTVFIFFQQIVLVFLCIFTLFSNRLVVLVLLLLKDRVHSQELPLLRAPTTFINFYSFFFIFRRSSWFFCFTSEFLSLFFSFFITIWNSGSRWFFFLNLVYSYKNYEKCLPLLLTHVFYLRGQEPLESRVLKVSWSTVRIRGSAARRGFSIEVVLLCIY